MIAQRLKNIDRYGLLGVVLAAFMLWGCTPDISRKGGVSWGTTASAPSFQKPKPLQFAAIKHIYADVYVQPDTTSERLTQCVYGDIVRLEVEHGSWYGVKVGPYPELAGWMHKSAVTLLPSGSLYLKERALATIVIRQESSQVFVWPSTTIAIVMGTELPFLEESGDWYLVRLPNNDIGRITRDSVAPAVIAQPLIIARQPETSSTVLSIPQTPAAGPQASRTTPRPTPPTNRPSSSIPNDKNKAPAANPSQLPKTEGKPRLALQPFIPERAEIVATARRFLGVTYVWGGTTRRGFDCSGLTYLVYKLNGIELPRLSTHQFSQKLGKKITKTQLKQGDLIFFQTISQGASHVGIYIGDNLFIHASPTYGVTISSLTEDYFKNRYYGARTLFPAS